MFVRSANNFDRRINSLECATLPKGKSLTVQSQRDSADINKMMERFQRTGMMPQAVRLPTYGDFGDEVFDYMTARNAIRKADEAFMELPPKVRAKFKNDPQAFMEFCAEKKNLPELREMGLAPPEKVVVEEKPMKVEVINPKEKDRGETKNS